MQHNYINCVLTTQFEYSNCRFARGHTPLNPFRLCCNRWEKATPEILETTARVYRERGVNNAIEDKEKRRREEDQKAKNTPKTRYNKG